MANLDQLLRGVKDGAGISCPTHPKKKAGRIAHIDGDYIAYIVSADRKDEEPTTMAGAKKHLEEFIDNILDFSGAVDYKIHLSQGKSGRVEQARLKEYQANRRDKETPPLLGAIRDYIAESLNCVYVDGMEADDTIAHYMYREAENDPVCISGDKDLMMIPGLHLNWSTLVMERVTFEGKLWMERYTTEGGNKVQKLRGNGGLFFIAQMLMGDSADNISGLPLCHGSLLNQVAKTKAVIAALEVLEDDKSTEAQLKKAEKVLVERKPKKCGEVLTFKLLEGLSLQEAVHRVVLLYALYGNFIGFRDYDDNPIDFGEAFDSEAKLLYMRHNLKEYDFQEFLRAAKHGQGTETFTRPSGEAPNSRT